MSADLIFNSDKSLENGCSIFPKWDPQNVDGSLSSIYEWVNAHTQQNIAWYNMRRASMKWWAQFIRSLAIGGGVIGGLCPLLASAMGKNFSFQGYVLNIDLSTWGYVFIALAAALVSTDKLYGFSKAWIRYAKTQLEIQATQSSFYMEWAGLVSNSNSGLDSKINLLKKHVLDVEALVQKETDQWVTEFNSSIAALEGQLKVGTSGKGASEVKDGKVG